MPPDRHDEDLALGRDFDSGPAVNDVAEESPPSLPPAHLPPAHPPPAHHPDPEASPGPSKTCTAPKYGITDEEGIMPLHKAGAEITNEKFKLTVEPKIVESDQVYQMACWILDRLEEADG